MPVSVFSDGIKFTGEALPGPAPGSYTFTSSTCTLVSDPAFPGEPNEGPFTCQTTSKFTLEPPAGGTAKVTSDDGRIDWSFTLARISNTSWEMSGNGTELDSSIDPADPASTAYPVTVKGTISTSPSALGLWVTGTVSFYESSDAP